MVVGDGGSDGALGVQPVDGQLVPGRDVGQNEPVEDLPRAGLKDGGGLAEGAALLTRFETEAGLPDGGGTGANDEAEAHEEKSADQHLHIGGIDRRVEG